jgi:hypothetical protein
MAPPEPFMSEPGLASLAGHRFPGGTYRVEHWENWLLTDCTGREPMPDGLVHPIVLFHAPILGANTSIGELFELAGASGDSGSVGLVGYDWEYLEPLGEGVEYAVDGGIVSAARRTTEARAIDDHVAFRRRMSATMRSRSATAVALRTSGACSSPERRIRSIAASAARGCSSHDRAMGSYSFWLRAPCSARNPSRRAT